METRRAASPCASPGQLTTLDSGVELGRELGKRNPQRLAPGARLDEVEAALATLALAHERLGGFEPLGEFNLRDPVLLPEIPEKLKEEVIVL